MIRKKSKSGPNIPDHGPGLIPPAELWGRRMGRPIPDADLPLEERVERAWRHITAMRFYEDEREVLREVLITTIELEVLKEEPT